MTKDELRDAIRADCHREEMADALIDRFISEGEGMLRRGLKFAVPLTVTLDEDDRDSEGVYTLPSGLLTVRAVYTDDAPEGAEQVSLASIRVLSASAPVLKFCVIGDTIEFRGVPGTDEEIELRYMGMPAALSADADTNDLLTDHETLYKSAASFYLYKHTQDLELAQGELDTFTAALDQLNEQQARKLGGATIAPAYHFGPIYRGY